MIWYWVTVVVELMVDLLVVRWQTADKDLEILLLRQQLRVLERKLGQRTRPTRVEKCVLAVVLVRLKHTTGQSRAQLAKLLIFSPQTVLNWHRELVRRKWTFRNKCRVGCPAIVEDCANW